MTCRCRQLNHIVRLRLLISLSDTNRNCSCVELARFMKPHRDKESVGQRLLSYVVLQELPFAMKSIVVTNISFHMSGSHGLPSSEESSTRRGKSLCSLSAPRSGPQLGPVT